MNKNALILCICFLFLTIYSLSSSLPTPQAHDQKTHARLHPDVEVTYAQCHETGCLAHFFLAKELIK